MNDTGWPLIPREVLPAPVKPAKIRTGPRRPGNDNEADTGRQLSIFGADTTEPSPSDLAGLLAGPGRIGRMGGTARVSVTVDAAWRVHALVTELVSRGLVVNWQRQDPEQDQDPKDVRDDAHPVVSERSGPSEPPVKKETAAPTTFDPDAEPPPDLPSDVDFLGDAQPEPVVVPAEVAVPEETVVTPSDATDTAAEEVPEGPELPEPPPKPLFEVVTAYSSRLNPLAKAWPAAAAQLFLSGPRLRLWVAAAGEPVPGGYALGLGPAKHHPEELRAIDAALVRAGLAGRLSEDGHHYVIAGRRRLKRLAELVGDRPAAAPPELWPDGAAA